MRVSWHTVVAILSAIIVGITHGLPYYEGFFGLALLLSRIDCLNYTITKRER